MRCWVTNDAMHLVLPEGVTYLDPGPALLGGLGTV